jgi:small ligand-binding sensory domain FIST
MDARIGTGLAATDGGVDAFAEAASRAALALGGARPDVAAVFAGAANLEHVDQGLAAVEDRLHARTVVGCGAQGVVGAGRELEHGGVVVWAASLPDADIEAFHLEAVSAGESKVAIAGVPDFAGADAVIMLADPYSFPVEPMLAEIADEQPGLPVLGGVTSAGGGPGAGVLLHDGRLASSGAVGVTLRGVDVRPCVSQGARPIGPEMVVTAAEGNVVYELASKPALARLREAIGELDHDERMLAGRGILLGIVIDENQPSYDRGDFLIRGVLDADDETGTLTIGEQVRVGQTVRLQVRDGASADEDLRAALAREAERLDGPPAGALLFTCNGRGSNMFDTPHHDAAAFADAFGDTPAAGFFCAGEIGPVGKRNFLHGFTATVALFAG